MSGTALLIRPDATRPAACSAGQRGGVEAEHFRDRPGADRDPECEVVGHEADTSGAPAAGTPGRVAQIVIVTGYSAVLLSVLPSPETGWTSILSTAGSPKLRSVGPASSTEVCLTEPEWNFCVTTS